MRVTLATETFAPQVNGVSRTLGQLVRALESAGDQVQVIHPRYDKTATACLQRLAVRSIRPPFYPELYLPMPPFGAVRRGIDAFGPDIVHVATEGTLGLAVLRHAKRLGIPVVSSFHTNFDQYTGHTTGSAGPGLWSGDTCEGSTTARGKRMFLRSPRSPSWSVGGSSVWRSGREGWIRPPSAPTVPAAGRFETPGVSVPMRSSSATSAGSPPRRTWGISARRWRRWPSFGRRCVCSSSATVPPRPELETRLGRSARFVGYRTGDDLADHYASCDLFAFASLTETFGNVVLEAMASGLPVVALRAGGPRPISCETASTASSSNRASLPRFSPTA